MSLYQIVFSPTGGTKKAADIITGELGENPVIIDLTDPKKDFSGYKLDENDTAVIAVPSYGGRVPETAARRLSLIKAAGTPCVLVCVYGNRAYEDTLAELEDISLGCGFIPVSAVAAVAEHSIVRKYAAGRPDARDREDLIHYAAEIKEKLGAKPQAAENIPGNRPYKKRSAAAALPKAGKTCVKCGICADNCPVGTIDKNNPSKTDASKCVSCMRCTAICPKSARSIAAPVKAAVALALRAACSDRKQNELYI